MKLLLISFVSWAAGMGSYLAAIGAVWGQRVSWGDLRAVLLLSGLASTIAVAVAYAPAMFVLRALLRRRSRGPYVLLGIGLGVFPVLAILRIFTADVLSSLITPEAGLFFCLFGVFGAVFGSAFFHAYARPSS